MRKGKRIFWCLWMLVVLLLGVGSVYALPSVKVTGLFTTDKVKIRVEGYQLEQGMEIPWKEELVVLPGQILPWIPRIYNEGCDCYVRVRAALQTVAGQCETTKLLRNEWSDDWIVAEDGCYYYSRPLMHGEFVDLLQGIRIPADLPQQVWQEQLANLCICVEAIQSSHITPDYTVESPWGQVEILEYAGEDAVEIHYVGLAEDRMENGMENAIVQLIWMGDTQQWLSQGDSLFETVTGFLPGDICQDSVRITNDSERERALYLRSEALGDSRLLSQLSLRILRRSAEADAVLYEGPLLSEALKGDRILDVISPGREMELVFEICVPRELDNEYAALREEICWTFSPEPLTEEQPDGESGETVDRDPGGAMDPDQTTSPATGDPKQWTEWVILMVMSCLVVCVLMLRKRRESKEEKDGT